MSYLPSQISCSYAGHPDFSAILLSLFPLTTLCVSFRNVPVHLWVLCAIETLGCCSKASSILTKGSWCCMGSFSLQGNHEFPPLFTLSSCARTERDFHRIDNSCHTPAWYQSASRNHDCTSYLSVLVLACCFTLTHHLHTNPVLCCLPCDLANLLLCHSGCISQHSLSL